MRDNTLSMTEVVRRVEQEEGGKGICVQIDNSSAFDLVRWDFIHEMLKGFGFPAQFRGLMETTYKDLKFKVKVNGRLGESTPANNGVRQGCGTSPLIFICCQEAYHRRPVSQD